MVSANLFSLNIYFPKPPLIIINIPIPGPLPFASPSALCPASRVLFRLHAEEINLKKPKMCVFPIAALPAAAFIGFEI